MTTPVQFTKNFLRIDSYAFENEPNMQVTRKRLSHWLQQHERLQRAGLNVACRWGHQRSELPWDRSTFQRMSSEERTAGVVKRLGLSKDRKSLSLTVELSDPRAIRLARANHVQVSPVIPQQAFQSGGGIQFRDVIAFVDLVNMPRDTSQTPFVEIKPPTKPKRPATRPQPKRKAIAMSTRKTGSQIEKLRDFSRLYVETGDARQAVIGAFPPDEAERILRTTDDAGQPIEIDDDLILDDHDLEGRAQLLLHVLSKTQGGNRLERVKAAIHEVFPVLYPIVYFENEQATEEKINPDEVQVAQPDLAALSLRGNDIGAMYARQLRPIRLSLANPDVEAFNRDDARLFTDELAARHPGMFRESTS
ncbi:MAG: hypothetical protein RIC55_12645 [Pirellulaceae bacterium]